VQLLAVGHGSGQLLDRVLQISLQTTRGGGVAAGEPRGSTARTCVPRQVEQGQSRHSYLLQKRPRRRRLLIRHLSPRHKKNYEVKQNKEFTVRGTVFLGEEAHPGESFLSRYGATRWQLSGFRAPPRECSAQPSSCTSPHCAGCVARSGAAHGAFVHRGRAVIPVVESARAGAGMQTRGLLRRGERHAQGVFSDH
jgi:hypothetical protein